MDAVELLREIGGPAGCRALSEAFYARVKRDPVLGPFFPGVSLRCAVEELSAFLVQVLGGPGEATQRRWWVSLRESHLRFRIGPREREAWLRNMCVTLEEAAMGDVPRDALRGLFEHSSAHVVNLGGEISPPAVEDSLWRGQRELDAAVAAVRAADPGQAIQLAEESEYVQGNPVVLASLLGLMLAVPDAALAAYVHATLERDPSLATVRYSGRTLMHAAAAAGDQATLELLLRLGTLPDTPDDGGHTALYCAANECKTRGGAGVVRALARAGAKVNSCDGVKRCTALHMAARRGREETAAALLDCGANLEARDSMGEPPCGVP